MEASSSSKGGEPEIDQQIGDSQPNDGMKNSSVAKKKTQQTIPQLFKKTTKRKSGAGDDKDDIGSDNSDKEEIDATKTKVKKKSESARTQIWIQSLKESFLVDALEEEKINNRTYITMACRICARNGQNETVKGADKGNFIRHLEVSFFLQFFSNQD